MNKQQRKPLNSQEFKNEKKYCDYLENNIELFCKDVLEAELISYKRESYITNYKPFSNNIPRVDFDILTNKGRFLVECKYPRGGVSDVSKAIGQLMSYAVIAEPEDVRLVIVTSKTNALVQRAILKYELPIKVVILTKKVLATWDIEFENMLKAGEIQVEKQYAIS